jgi:hypothetical protein
MLRKRLTFLGLVVGLLTMFASLAMAHILTSATATANCTGYSLTVNATDLTKHTTYTIDYTFTVTCGSSSPVTIPGSVTFKATAVTLTETASGSWSPGTVVGSCTVTGTATLTSSGSMVSININGTTSPAPLTCPSTLTLACPASTGTVGVPYSSSLVATGGVPPYVYEGISGSIPGVTSLNATTGLLSGTPTEAGTFTAEFGVTDSVSDRATANCTFTFTSSLPTACVIPPSGTAIPGAPVSWNGFSAPAGSVVWINAHIQSPSGVPTNTITTVDFTDVSLVVNTTTYALPNGQIVFNPATSTASTIVNADGSWTTTVNPSTSGDIFFDGQAIPVNSNLENGGGGNTSSTFSFTTNSSDSALSFQWQWGAAVYTSWPGNAAANIEPLQANGLQPGAPQNPAVQADLIQGPRGGGGSNFTGSWSGTGQGTCPN